MKASSRRRLLLAVAVAVPLMATTSWTWPDTDQTASTGADTQAVYGGLPKARPFTLRSWTRILENRGFTVGYSELRRNPLWVVYHVRPIQRRKSYRRPKDFQVDSRTLVRVSQRDYLNSGYQRGHLAPSWLIAQLHGREAQRQTFLMSNITPQKPRLNQKLWQRLEEVEADHFARWFNGVWVITGPVFDDHIQHLRSGVEVPDAFYRIYLDEADASGRPKALAFLVPQTVRGDEPLGRFKTTVDDIETRTGLDFLPALEDGLEASLEASLADDRDWRLSEVCCLPPRY